MEQSFAWQKWPLSELKRFSARSGSETRFSFVAFDAFSAANREATSPDNEPVAGYRWLQGRNDMEMLNRSFAAERVSDVPRAGGFPRATLWIECQRGGKQQVTPPCCAPDPASTAPSR